MENEKSIDMLIERLEKLDNGVYNYNGIKIDTRKDTSIIKFSDGTPKSDTPRIEVFYNGCYFDIEIILDKNSTLNMSKDLNNLWETCCIYTKNEQQNYKIEKKGIHVDNKFYYILENNLFVKVDNTCWLSYDLNDDKIYVYYNENVRKYNKPFETKDNEGFIKFQYNENFITELEYFKKEISEILLKFKDSKKDSFKALAELMVSSIPTIHSEFSVEIDKLNETAKIYKIYKDKLNLENHEQELDEVYNFANTLINDPQEAIKNNIQHMIENIDLNNKEELVKLRTEIDNMLKPNKKIRKLKK